MASSTDALDTALFEAFEVASEDSSSASERSKQRMASLTGALSWASLSNKTIPRLARATATAGCSGP
jgi:hypothetical protein